MAIIYRTARTTDIQTVSEIYWESILDVYQRHGFEDRRPAYPVNPFYEFCLRQEPGGFFVAEEEGKVIGAVFSWVRGHVWFLSHLFVLPPYQGTGIGRTLLDLTLQHGGTSEATVRAVITMAFNPASIALYMKAGMSPVQNIYLMKASKNPCLNHEPNLAYEKSEHCAWQSKDMEALDMEVLNIPRPLHHQYYLGREEASCRIFRIGGRAIAYAYHWKDGRIGPVSAVEDAPYEAILKTVMALAYEESESISLMVPGSNTVAMRTALAHGFSIVMPYVLLSSRPLGCWDHYLFHSPGMM